MVKIPNDQPENNILRWTLYKYVLKWFTFPVHEISKHKGYL